MKKKHEKKELINEIYFNESKLKLPKDFLKKSRTEFNVLQFIPLKVKKKIQQVDIEYGLFS